MYEPLISSAEEDALTTVSIASAIRLALERGCVREGVFGERVSGLYTSFYINRFIQVAWVERDTSQHLR